VRVSSAFPKSSGMVMEEAEWKILPQALALYCAGRLSVEGRVVKISGGEK